MSEPTYRIAQVLLYRRAKAGLCSYGEHLKPFNKRCSLIDAIEESADMLCYLLNMAQESRHLMIDLIANSVRLREAGHTAAADGLDKIIVGMGGKETLSRYDEILGTVAENATVAPERGMPKEQLDRIRQEIAKVAAINRPLTTEERETFDRAVAELPETHEAPDPRDEALRVAEEKTWKVVMFLDGVHRHRLIENYSPDYSGLQDARVDAAAALAAIRGAR